MNENGTAETLIKTIGNCEESHRILCEVIRKATRLKEYCERHQIPVMHMAEDIEKFTNKLFVVNSATFLTCATEATKSESTGKKVESIIALNRDFSVLWGEALERQT